MAPAFSTDMSPNKLSSLIHSLDVATMLHNGTRLVQACAAGQPTQPPTAAAIRAMDDLQHGTEDTLVQLLCYYLFLNTAPLFTSARLDPSETPALVTGSLPPLHPARVQLQLLGTVTPALACIAHDEPRALQQCVPPALTWLGTHVHPVQSAPTGPLLSIRVPRAIGALALDLDDTIVMHTLMPGFKIVFEAIDALAPAAILEAMLRNATPHLSFLRSLAASMHSTQRPLFITSFGSEAWVRRAVHVLFGDAVPPRVLCRSDTPADVAEVVDKNVWLTVVQRSTGLSRQQVLLVDDSRRNVRTACAAGFAALQVDRGEGVHVGNWAAVCQALWQRADREVDAGSVDECGALSPRGFEAAVDAELARVDDAPVAQDPGDCQDAHRAPCGPSAPGRRRRAAALAGPLRRRLLSLLHGRGRAPAAPLRVVLDAYDSQFAWGSKGHHLCQPSELGTPSTLQLRLGPGEQGANSGSLRRVLLVATGGAVCDSNV